MHRKMAAPSRTTAGLCLRCSSRRLNAAPSKADKGDDADPCADKQADCQPDQPAQPTLLSSDGIYPIEQRILFALAHLIPHLEGRECRVQSRPHRRRSVSRIASIVSDRRSSALHWPLSTILLKGFRTYQKYRWAKLLTGARAVADALPDKLVALPVKQVVTLAARRVGAAISDLSADRNGHQIEMTFLRSAQESCWSTVSSKIILHW